MLAIRLSRGDEAVAVGDRAGVIEWTNTAWRRVTGWALEDVVDKPVSELLDRVGVERAVLDFVRNHYVAGRSCALELSIEGDDGQTRAIHLDVEPLRDETGDVAHFVAVASDVTERRRAEEARAHEAGSPATTRRAAEEDALARVAPLERFAVESLRAAREIERLCAEIERTTAVGLLDELGVRSVWERAAAAADAARSLLDRASAAPAPRTAVDVSALVRDCLALVDREIPARVQLDVDLADALPTGWARAQDLAEVVTDCLRAAAHAIEDSWGTLSVTTGVTQPGRPLVSSVYHASFLGTLDDDAPRCFIEIHDTATSLPPDAPHRIAGGVLPLAAAGRVASLALARARLVDAGVAMHVHSTTGCGTRVLLLVPVHRD